MRFHALVLSRLHRRAFEFRGLRSMVGVVFILRFQTSRFLKNKSTHLWFLGAHHWSADELVLIANNQFDLLSVSTLCVVVQVKS